MRDSYFFTLIKLVTAIEGCLCGLGIFMEQFLE